MSPGTSPPARSRPDRAGAVSRETGRGEDANAWAASAGADWLDPVIEAEAKLVRSGGERRLARRLPYELHQALFGVAGVLFALFG